MDAITNEVHCLLEIMFVCPPVMAYALLRICLVHRDFIPAHFLVELVLTKYVAVKLSSPINDKDNAKKTWQFVNFMSIFVVIINSYIFT